MNTKLSKLVLAMGALMMAGGAMAQSEATAADAVANATVIRPITIAANGSLEFGSIVAGAGTVLIGTDGVRVDSTPTLTPGTQQKTLSAAIFDVTGEVAATYDITLPADDVVILKTGDGTLPVDQMKLSSFTKAAVDGTLGTLSGTAGAVGTQSFNVGATLTGIASQNAGAYTATYSVTVAYN